VHVLSLTGGAWNFGGSIMTFLFPEILFVLVATALFVLYTKPEVVPGHWVGRVERPVSYTAAARLQQASAPPAPAGESPAAVAGGADGGSAEAAAAGAAEQPQTATVTDGGAAGSADGGAAGSGDGGAAGGGAAGAGDGA
jgi:hypothetical protein